MFGFNPVREAISIGGEPVRLDWTLEMPRPGEPAAFPPSTTVAPPATPAATGATPAEGVAPAPAVTSPSTPVATAESTTFLSSGSGGQTHGQGNNNGKQQNG